MANWRQTQENTGYRTLRTELKAGQFRKIYFFYGPEDYLREYYRRDLRKRLTDGPAADFNYHRFTEENWALEALSEAMEAIPVMAERSLVEIVDVDPFKLGESQRAALTELIAEQPEYCTVLFVLYGAEWKPDKRMKKLWSAMQDAALLVEFSKQPEEELIPWVRRHLAAGQKVMSDNLIRRLLLLTGSSMSTLDAELEKLISCTDQREITAHDVDAVVIPVLEARVFDITDDIGKRDFERALVKLRELLQQEEEPIAINALIGRQLRQLYTAKVLSEHGKGPGELQRLLGLWSSAAQRIYSQASSFSKPVLRQAMLLSARTDYAMKTSGGDKAALLEYEVLQLAEATSP